MENRIKIVIKEKGYTIKSLADKMGMTRENLSRTIVNPSSPTLEKLSEALDVPVWQFFASREDIEGSASSSSDLVALIRNRGQLYQASTIEELESLVGQLKEGK